MAFVTGTHRYASDTRRDGMLFGKVLRPPAHGAKLASVDTKAAEGVAGVRVVREGDFVGVTAPIVSFSVRYRREVNNGCQECELILTDAIELLASRSLTLPARQEK